MKATIAILMMLLMIGVATADTPLPSTIVSYDAGSAQPTGAPLLGFISGTVNTKETDSYHATTPNRFAELKSVGARCETGEYVRPYRCSSKWSGCQRVFNDDWLKTSSSDALPIRSWTSASWYLQDESARPWDMYVCLAKLSTPKPPPPPEADGYFTGTITYSPTSPEVNEHITIKGSFKATKSGPLVLEAFLDTSSRQPLQVISASKSSCDSSNYWAGSQIQSVAGTRYDYAFTVKTPPTDGKYNIVVHAWTGCAKDGGEKITDTYKQVTVKKTILCNAQGFLNDIGHELENYISVAAFWSNPDQSYDQIKASNYWRNTLSIYGCNDAQVASACGTKDTDGDAIPDECDYCPKDKGIVQDAMGCVPCFGMDYHSAAGKACWLENRNTFPIPSTIINVVDPVVKSKSYCLSNFEFETQQIRQSGDIAKETQVFCSTDEICKENGDTATCSDKQVAKTETTCYKDNVAIRTYYEDSTSKITNPEKYTCEFGCLIDECKPDPNLCNGRSCSDDEPVVAPEDPECTQDSQCKANEFCQTQICVLNPTYCFSESDCQSNEYCNAGRCEVLNIPDCTNNAQCDPGFECVQEVCVNKGECNTGQKKYGGPCLDGSTPLNAECINGKWEYYTNSCPVIPTGYCTVDIKQTCSDGKVYVRQACVNNILSDEIRQCPSAEPKGCVFDFNCDSGHKCQNFKCVTQDTPEPSVCPSICTTAYELPDCEVNTCYSGCGPDEVNAFSSQTACQTVGSSTKAYRKMSETSYKNLDESGKLETLSSKSSRKIGVSIGLSFKHAGSHTAKLLRVNYDANIANRWAEIELTSTPQLIVVYEGETVSADSNLDGIDDVAITVEEVTATDAIITFLEILTESIIDNPYFTCTTDSDCGNNEQCLDGDCRAMAVWEGTDEPATCTEDRYITCDTGGNVIVEMCVDGSPVPIDNTCVTEYSNGKPSSGPISNIPGIETISIPTIPFTQDTDKNQNYTYGAIAILILGGLAYVISIRKPKKGRRKK